MRFTQALAESLRVLTQGSARLKDVFGSSALALDQALYGLLLVVFIIYMPRGYSAPRGNTGSGAARMRAACLALEARGPPASGEGQCARFRRRRSAPNERLC